MSSHPDYSNKLPKKFTCAVCNNIYSAYKSLKRHVKLNHPDQVDDLAPLRKKRGSCEFKCDYCTCRFSKAYNLRSHVRNMHSGEKNSSNFELLRMKKCTLCCYECRKEEMFSHFELDHNLNLEFLELNFKTFEDFMMWKEKIQKETNSRYILERGAKKIKDFWVYNFSCYRSGFHISEGKGLRRPRKRGSCKIGGFCPASIKVCKLVDNYCEVHYISTHIGHQSDFNDLTTSEKEDSVLEVEIQELMCMEDESQTTIQEKNHLNAEASEHNSKFSNKSLSDRKKRLIERFTAIVYSIETEEEFNTLEDTLSPIFLKNKTRR